MNNIIPSIAENKIELNLCKLTELIVENKLADEPGYGLGGHWSYGTDFENSTFLIHSFCWCEEDDCPWCIGCSCSDNAYHHYIDNKEVSSKEWHNFYKKNIDDIPYNATKKEWEEYEKKVDEINKRRKSEHTPDCNYCLTGSIAISKGGEPGKSAPNFWYKPTNLKIWWYKWIGRDMEYNREASTEEWNKIFDGCIKSLTK